jgi:hypothetical protein
VARLGQVNDTNQLVITELAAIRAYSTHGPKYSPFFTGFGEAAAYPVLTKWAVFWAVWLMWFPAPFATVNPWNLCGAQHRENSEQFNYGS